MLTVEEALEQILSRIRVLGTEGVELSSALGIQGQVFYDLGDLDAAFDAAARGLELGASDDAYTQILTQSRKQKISMRLAALSVGIKRVQEAKKIRGFLNRSKLVRLAALMLR